MPPATDSCWTGLVDDAAPLARSEADLPACVSAHTAREHPLFGALAVRDTDLPLLPRDPDVGLLVTLTGGAGQVAGPAAFCGRAGLRLSGLEVALRDLDDLAGNARRVVTAVDAARADGSLDEDVPVYVELPASDPSYGWLAAADEIAGAELRLALRAAEAPAPILAAWIDAALDRETPFRCPTGLRHAVRGDAGHGFLNVLLATVRAFDGAAPDEVVATLEDRDPAHDPAELARGRRWFASFGTDSADEALADLRERGLLA